MPKNLLEFSKINKTYFVSFFCAGLLHPIEFSCIIPGILYFLAIPCMYMLLTVYSLCNMNIVSWGTRENVLDGIDKTKIDTKVRKLKFKFAKLEKIL